ncbi:MAG: hypothetical protein U0169_13545 [Polyangiaceae bacterium]
MTSGLRRRPWDVLLASASIAACLAGSLAGCRKAPPTSDTQGPPAATTGDPSSPPESSPCTDMPCESFDSPQAATDRVLATRPRVLAVGESHAPAEGPKVPSSTVRFKELLLPRLHARATDMVLEIWAANGSCGKNEAVVRAKQEPVVRAEAKTNPNRSSRWETPPTVSASRPVLVPSCEEYARIVDAGDSDIETMLRTIAERSRLVALAHLPPEGDPRLLLMYKAHAGRLRAAGKGRSFGPALAAAVGGRYVELDLVVPEFVRDTDVEGPALVRAVRSDEARHEDRAPRAP